MNTSEDLILDTAAHLYEAAATPEKWPEALSRVSGLLDARYTQFFVMDRHTMRGTSSIVGSLPGQEPDPAQVAAYVQHYSAIDPRLPILASRRVGHVATCTDIITAEQARRSEFYNDFLSRNDIRWAAVFTLPWGQDHLGVLAPQRRPAQEPFGPKETRLLERLGPHVVRAGAIAEKFSQLRMVNEIATAFIDRAAMPVAATDRLGRLVYSNAAFEALAKRPGTGISIKRERLAATDVAADHKLQGAIAAATVTRSRDSQALGNAVTLPAGEGVGALLAVVAPLPTGLSEIFASDRTLALIMISNPASDDTVAPDHLRTWFGLTSAEAAFAAELAKGTSPEGIAAARGVRISTVRTQLSSVLAKLGVTRQVELVRLLTKLATTRRV